MEKKIALIGLCGNSYFYNVEELPKPGDRTTAKAWFSEVGGKGMNQAIQANRLGLHTYFLGAIGHDKDGSAVIDALENEGVDYSLEIKDDGKTATAHIFNCKGENRLLINHGATDMLTVEDFKEFRPKFREADMVLLNYEVPKPVVKEAISYAKKHNIKIVINPAPYLYNDIDIMSSAYCLTPNEEEAKQLLELDEINSKDVIKKMVLKYLDRLVITMGKKGCMVIENKKATMIPAYNTKLVDSTGAGDSFSASMCFGLLNGLDLIKACEFATYVAGLEVSRHGVLEALPYYAEVRKFFETPVEEKKKKRLTWKELEIKEIEADEEARNNN